MIKEEILNRFNVTETDLYNKIVTNKNDIVFLSGSLFDNLGNARSDLDIFLITDDFHPLLQNERVQDQNIIINDKRYDLSIFSRSLIEETERVLRKLDFNNPHNYFPRQLHPQISNYEICTMVHRLKKGEVIFNSDEFSKILKQFPFSLYINWMIRLKMNEYDGLYEDVLGSLESHDLLTAGELVQQQLHLVAQLILLSAGQTFDRDKWVLRKLFQVSQKDAVSMSLFEEFLEVKRSITIGDELNILEAIRFCERQVESLQMELFQ